MGHGEGCVCVVLGLAQVSLGVIRSLGRKNIRVIGVDYTKCPIGSYSKYCTTLNCPEPDRDEEGLLGFMKALGRELGQEGVLLPTNDRFVHFVSRNEEALRPSFRFIVPKEGVVEALNDKRKFAVLAEEMGMDIPRTFSPSTMREVEEVSEKINYPSIVKPAYGYLYERVLVKGVVVKESSELVEGWNRMSALDGQIVIQEYVGGSDVLEYSLGAYFNEASEPLAVFTARKLRQNPPGTGVGTLVESCEEAEIIDKGVSFLRGIGFKGTGEIEFKRAGSGGSLKIIEVNTRIWGQNSLAVRCGIDMPYVAYCDACGIDVHKSDNRSWEKNIKWLDFSGDFFACFGSSGYLRKEELTVKSWLSSLRGPKEFAVFSADDLCPFIRSLGRFVLMLARRIGGRVGVNR